MMGIILDAEVFCEIAIFAIVIDHHDRLFFVALRFELIFDRRRAVEG